MKENIGTVEYASLLYDFYGALLNESQLEVMTMYHEDNLSLSEIAEELGMTRQAVHYTLKKAESKLEEYDKKLGLVDTYRKNQEKAAKAIAILQNANSMLGLELQNANQTIGLELQEVIDLIEELAE